VKLREERDGKKKKTIYGKERKLTNSAEKPERKSRGGVPKIKSEKKGQGG